MSDEAKPAEGSSALTVEAPKVPAALPEGTTSELPAWMAQLTPDLKSEKNLTRFKSISELGKAVLDLEGKASNAVVVPGESATKEEWASYFKKIGRPENPKDYKLEKTALPKGLSDDPKSEEEFLAVAHKLGLTQAQVKDIHQWYQNSRVKAFQEAAQAVQASTDECVATLRKEYGEKTQEELAHANRAFTRYEDKKGVVRGLFNQSNLGNHPEILKMFARIAKEISEAGAPKAETQTAAVGGRGREAELAELLYKKGA